MLAPRFVRAATSLARPFSSSAVAYRAPSIRDLTAESAEYNRRQKEFRENLEEARKRKEQQESQSVNTSSSTLSRELFPLLHM